MRIIIDAQNMLYALPVYRNVLLKNHQNAVDQLIHDLSQYHDWTGHEVTIVFDGPPRYSYPIESYGIEILHSGTQKTADAIIESLVGRSLSKFDILVITSDHGLQNLVFALGARWASPKLFEKMMEKGGAS
jgi:predicted RNA-binding protein with PIN domain